MTQELTKWVQAIEEKCVSWISIQNNNDNRPWFNYELGQLRYKYLKSESLEMKRSLRNLYVTALRKAKRSYQREFIKRHRNSGGVWKLLRRKTSSEVNEIVVDGESVKDKGLIAAHFRDCFKSKVERLKREADCNPIIAKLQESFGQQPPWDIRCCTKEEVARCIDKLSPSLSTGPDNISNRILKCLKFEMLKPLTSLFNASILTGIYPTMWKLAKIRPVHKKGSKSDISTYRPVALTSSVGKLFEAVLRLQLGPVFERILPDCMHGFRVGHSTETALINVIESIKEKKAKGQKVAVLSLDQSAAFDLCSHKIIICSLATLGAGPLVLAWLKSYLKGCQYHIDLEGTRSQSWESDVGVGQGKRLSVDLFSISGLTQALWSRISDPHFFADDGLDVISAKTLSELNQRIQQVADLRADWFRLAGLTINDTKTELIGFGVNPDPVLINGTVIYPSTHLKFLGLTIQSNLKFDHQVGSLCNKLRCLAGRIRAEAGNLTIRDRRTLFNGWIRGTLNSNMLAYFPLLPSGLMHNVETAFNAGIRAVVGISRKGVAPITDIRERLGIPSIQQIFKKGLWLAAWKKRQEFRATQCLGPKTRARSKGNVPHIDINAFPITSRIIQAWNELPQDIKVENKNSTASRKIAKYCRN